MTFALIEKLKACRVCDKQRFGKTLAAVASYRFCDLLIFTDGTWASVVGHDDEFDIATHIVFESDKPLSRDPLIANGIVTEAEFVQFKAEWIEHRKRIADKNERAQYEMLKARVEGVP